MTEKIEPRVDVELPIRVFGMGADGRPFLQNAQARNISHHGAKLSGLESQLKPGDVIGVQAGDRKARCKVIWVVDGGAAQKITVGVSLVEGQSCPWENEMQQNEGTPRIAPDTNKREFSRHRVPLPLEIRTPDGVGTYMRTRSADISGRGCYVETMLPLPVGKILTITFWLDSEKISTPAVIRSSDGGVGMGIEFTGLDEPTSERLQKHIEGMASVEETSDKPLDAG
jgi:PilZ domain